MQRNGAADCLKSSADVYDYFGNYSALFLPVFRRCEH